VFGDIHTRVINSFDDNATFGLGNVAPAGVQNMITGLTGTGDPDHTVFAFNGHPMLAIVQAQHLTWLKK
jgi:hypothetical protein